MQPLKVRLWVPLLPVLLPHKKRFILGAGLILISVVIDIVIPCVTGACVDVVTKLSPRFQVVQLCSLFLGLIVLKCLIEFVQAYLIQSTGQSVMHDLRKIVFHKITSLPIGYFDKNPTGRLLTRVINDIKSLSELFTSSFSVVVLDVLLVLGTVVAMLWLQWDLALLVLLTFPAVVLSVRYFGKGLSACTRRVRAKLAEINAFLGENIGALSTIKRLSAEESRYLTFAEIVENHQIAQMASLRIFAMVQPCTNLFNGIAMATLIIVGGRAVIRGEMSVGSLVTFLGYVKNLFQPIRDLVEKYNTLLSAAISGERVLQILDERGEDSGRWQGGSASHLGVVFKDVSFKYSSRERKVIEALSFRIGEGESVAIVGETGSGKSTIIRLMLRFYEPQEGEISLWGVHLSRWDLASLRRNLGVVHQDISLFRGSLRDNLLGGIQVPSDDRMVMGCRQAQLWDLVEPRGGLDMEILEGGANLSLGERQLISFARILVMDCRVLIMDEATAHLDRAVEKRLMGAMKEIKVGRTCIIVAHRLSTIRECSRILMIEGGRVCEEGGYEELCLMNGKFSRLIRHDALVS